MVMLYHIGQDAVWGISFDQGLGGFVGRSDGYITPAFVNEGAVIRHIESGKPVRLERVSAPGGAERSGAEQKGLVPHQQSSPHPSPMSIAEVLEADLARRSHLRDVLYQHTREVVKSWNITLRDDDGKFLTLNSQKMRLSRCQRRVYAWSGAVSDVIEGVSSRRERRASERKKCNRRRKGQVIEDLSYRLVMMTLTYADADAWEPNQIRGFVKTVRRSLVDNLLAYSWVLEVQGRGSPHYHVLLYVRRGTRIPKPDEAGWWSYGLTRIETAKSPFYIVKYTGKEYQKQGLPKGARMFAVWISPDAVPADVLFRFRLSAVPAWLCSALEDVARVAGTEVRWRRARGGGWLVKNTGEILTSGWSVVSILPGDGRVLDTDQVAA